MSISFNANDIHKLRIILAERLDKLLPEDAERDFKETVRLERLAIASVQSHAVQSSTNNTSISTSI